MLISHQLLRASDIACRSSDICSAKFSSKTFTLDLLLVLESFDMAPVAYWILQRTVLSSRYQLQ